MMRFYLINKKIVALVHTLTYISRYVSHFGEPVSASTDVDLLIMPAFYWNRILTLGGQNEFKKVIRSWTRLNPRKIIYSGDNEGGYNLERFQLVQNILHTTFPNIPIIIISQNERAFTDHGWPIHHGFLIELYNDSISSSNTLQETSQDDAQDAPKKRFLALGGCPRPNKLFVFCLLKQHGLLNTDLTEWSLGKLRVDIGKAWEIPSYSTHAAVQQQFTNLKSDLPKSIDLPDCGIKRGTISFNLPLMLRARFQIVIETDLSYGKYQIRVTEKTLKCFMSQQPFVIFGNPHSLRYVHRLGFKTFSTVFGEEYDRIEDPIKRSEAVCKILCNFAKLSDEDFEQQIIIPCKSICVYNYRRITSTEFQKNHYMDLFQ